MIAIIKTLFGGGKKDKGPAYFLDNDSAKSLGNIEYMRTPKVVKKSYAQAVGKLNVLSGEVEESISAMEKKQVGMNGSMTSSTSSSSSVTQSSTFTNTSTPSRRGSNSSMDSFRDMARNMKKK